MPESAALIWFEAIARRRCVTAIYNGVAAKLAPHILYTRADQLYVAAVAIERRGIRVPDRKLGIFKVSGLRECVLVEEPFTIDPAFDSRDPRYAGTTVFAVEG